MSARNGSKRRRQRGPFWVLFSGLGVMTLIAVVAYVSLRAPNGIPGVDYRYNYVNTPAVSNLRTHNDVRIDGVRVGQILKLTPEDGYVRLKLQFSGDIGTLPEDTTAVVRSRGLLGARFLQLIPGRSARALPEGATIGAGSLPVTYGVPEALQTFDRETRGALGSAVHDLGDGVLGRADDINEAMRLGPTGARNFRSVAAALLEHPERLHRLVPDLSSAAAAIDPARRATVDAVDSTERWLRALPDRADATRETLERLPESLVAVRSASTGSRPLFANLRDLATEADATLADAPEALKETTALLRRAPTHLRRALPVLHEVHDAVPPALRLAKAAAPVLRPLRQPLERLQQTLRGLGAHGCDVVNFARNWRSFLAMGVPGGGVLGPLGEIRATLFIHQPYREQGNAIAAPQIEKVDAYPDPCEYGPTRYSSVVPNP